MRGSTFFVYALGVIAFVFFVLVLFNLWRLVA